MRLKTRIGFWHINPNSWFKTTWDICVIVTAAFAALDIPIRLALSYPYEGIFLKIDIFITTVFSLDILLAFFTPVNKNNRYITSYDKIAKHYFRKKFIFDLLATIPFDLCIRQIFDDETTILSSIVPYLRFLRLIKVFYLVRITYLMKKWNYLHLFNPSAVRLCFLAFWILMLYHWIACGWLLIYHENVPDNRYSHYVQALYWTMLTVTTVGYGDITPQTDIQRVYTMAVMIIGVGMYGYIIGNMAGLISNLDVSHTNYLKKIENLNMFYRIHRIPTPLRKKVANYYSRLRESKLDYDVNIILNELPQSIRKELLVYLNQDVVKKVPLFKNAGPRLITEITAVLSSCFYAPNEVIVVKGEAGRSMYFIGKGTVDILSEDGKSVRKTLFEGDFFGEFSLIFNQPRVATIRARDYCELYMLDHEALSKVLKNHPNFKNTLDMTIKQRGEV